MAGLDTLEAVTLAGYCVDEWERWCQGDCDTYAVALMRMQARLHFGVAGQLTGTLETIERDGWMPRHFFAHDEHWVYDAAGMHSRKGYAGIHGEFDYVEFDGDPADWDAIDEDLIEAAQDHARRNGIFSGRYGPVTVVTVDSHRARAKLDQLLGWHDDGYYNADALLRDGNDYHIVPTVLLGEVARIKSITVRKKPPANLARRWSTL